MRKGLIFNNLPALITAAFISWLDMYPLPLMYCFDYSKEWYDATVIESNHINLPDHPLLLPLHHSSRCCL